MAEQTDGKNPGIENASRDSSQDPYKIGPGDLLKALNGVPRAKRWGLIAGAITGVFVIAFGLSAWVTPELRSRIPFLDHVLPAPPEQAGRIETLESDVAELHREMATLTDQMKGQRFDIDALRRQDEGISAQIADLGIGGGTPGVNTLNHGAPAGAVGGRVDMLASRVAQLEAAFIPLSRRAQADAEAAKDRAALRTRAQELEKVIGGLNGRIAALEEFATTDRQGSVLGLTLAQLRRTLDNGQPFETELGLLLDLVPDSSLKPDSPARDSIKTLQDWAPEGVATKDQLRQRFDRMAVSVLRASKTADDAGWFGRSWGRVMGLIVIRKRGDVQGDDPAAILARAEVRLGEDDLDGALTELDALKGGAAEAAQAWKKAADARQNVNGAIEQLSASLAEEASKTPPLAAAATSPQSPAQSPAQPPARSPARSPDSGPHAGAR